ncbi:MAG: hypothetical protein FWC01_02875 [Treponema sp.]|nr:hypothetical protein [Treponema sp.]MCL2236933.1 hypothetical protein [Treponema sp.]
MKTSSLKVRLGLTVRLCLTAWLCRAIFCGADVLAEEPEEEVAAEIITEAIVTETAEKPAAKIFNWSLTWNGSWEKTSLKLLNRTFHNQAELQLDILPADILLSARFLDRRTFDFELEEPLTNPLREATNVTGGLYHLSTGSKAVYGVLDEWGLPARIRNPWIRSPPYPENHGASSADMESEASSSKHDEMYLFLSTPMLSLSQNFGIRGFASAQMEIESGAMAFLGGLNLSIKRKTDLLLEAFYTERTLAPKTIGTWFGYPPPLPQRESVLYAAAFHIKSPKFSVSSDFAVSETFAWGTDIYANMGMTLSLRPIYISIAADGAGERFVFRDGAHREERFRGAAKIEWISRYNSVFRIDSVMRSPAFGEPFYTGSVGLYYRPPNRRDESIFRLTRVSVSADNIGENEKITGFVGFGIGIRKIGLSNPLRINLSGSWEEESAAGSLEFILTYRNFQLRSKAGMTIYAEKDNKFDLSISTSIRFRRGRMSLGAESPDFPERWNWSISWRAELFGKS